jgi:gamma-glutamylcyclotransferase (GGCT)/AIG2-like uncharacterized protein YtfP
MIPPAAADSDDVIFIYGTLTDPDVLACVLNRRVAAEEMELAVLRNAKRVRAADATYPVVVSALGHAVSGWIIRSISARDLVRLNHFEAGEYQAERRPVHLEDGDLRSAWLYVALAAFTATDQPWDLATWQRQHKAAFLAQCEAWMADCPDPG